jgi:hypothetical protein
MSQSPETNAELAISPTKIISSILVQFLLYTKKMIREFSFPLLSLRTVITVTNSYGITSVPTVLFKDVRHQPNIPSFFSPLLVPKCMFKLPAGEHV